MILLGPVLLFSWGSRDGGVFVLDRVALSFEKRNQGRSHVVVTSHSKRKQLYRGGRS